MPAYWLEPGHSLISRKALADELWELMVCPPHRQVRLHDDEIEVEVGEDGRHKVTHRRTGAYGHGADLEEAKRNLRAILRH